MQSLWLKSVAYLFLSGESSVEISESALGLSGVTSGVESDGKHFVGGESEIL